MPGGRKAPSWRQGRTRSESEPDPSQIRFQYHRGTTFHHARDQGAVLASARAPRVRATKALPEERRPFGSQRAQGHAATKPHRDHSDSRLGGASWLCVGGGCGGRRQERLMGRRCPSANACLLARCSCRAIVPRCAGSCLLGQCPPGADSLSAWRSTVACWSGHRHRHMEPATASYLTTVVTLFYCFEHTGPQDNVLIPVLDKPHVVLLHPKLVDALIMYQIIINLYVSRNTFLCEHQTIVIKNRKSFPLPCQLF